MKRSTPSQVEQQIETLRASDVKALRVRWREVFRTEPPAKMQSGFLRPAIAYRLQEQAFGGVKPESARQLRKYGKALDASPPMTLEGSTPARVVLFDAKTSLSPGTRLMREWNGSTELVDVVVGGFTWRGKPFKTLSAVAVAITGTKWSGPKFFGLLGQKTANTNRLAKPVGHQNAALVGKAA